LTGEGDLLKGAEPGSSNGGPQKGVLQIEFTIVRQTATLQRKWSIAAKRQMQAANSLFPVESDGSLRPRIDD
jgi:hypothetical protein